MHPHHPQSLARARSGGAPSLQLAWQQGFERLAFLPPDLLAELAHNLPDPAAARRLAAALAREPQPEAATRAFLNAAADGNLDTPAWCLGFARLAAHLESDSRQPSLQAITGYLDCCLALMRTSPQFVAFPELVETLYEAYGFQEDGSGTTLGG